MCRDIGALGDSIILPIRGLLVQDTMIRDIKESAIQPEELKNSATITPGLGGHNESLHAPYESSDHVPNDAITGATL